MSMFVCIGKKKRGKKLIEEIFLLLFFVRFVWQLDFFISMSLERVRAILTQSKFNLHEVERLSKIAFLYAELKYMN